MKNYILKEFKPLKKCPEEALPEPFLTYWRSGDKLERPDWEFYLDMHNELYIQNYWHNEILDFPRHWTATNCCGVHNYYQKLRANGYKRPSHVHDIKCLCGCNVFYLNYGEYEINGTCGKCYKEYTLYSG